MATNYFWKVWLRLNLLIKDALKVITRYSSRSNLLNEARMVEYDKKVIIP